MSETSVIKAEIESAKYILTAMADDIALINRYWPEAKRGSNGSFAFKSLLARRDAALLCLDDAIGSPSP